MLPPLPQPFRSGDTLRAADLEALRLHAAAAAEAITAAGVALRTPRAGVDRYRPPQIVRCIVTQATRTEPDYIDQISYSLYMPELGVETADLIDHTRRVCPCAPGQEGAIKIVPALVYTPGMDQPWRAEGLVYLWPEDGARMTALLFGESPARRVCGS